MPSWPASLPTWLIDSSYQEEPPERTIESRMDAGPAAVRRRFTAGETAISGRIPLSAAEKTTLDTFFRDELKSGALTFDRAHPVTGEVKTFRMRRPSYSARGAVFLAEIELLEQP